MCTKAADRTKSCAKTRGVASWCAINTRGRDSARRGRRMSSRPPSTSEVSLPAGSFIELGGQFQAQQSASRRILVLSAVAVCVVFGVLYTLPTECVDRASKSLPRCQRPSWEASRRCVAHGAKPLRPRDGRIHLARRHRRPQRAAPRFDLLVASIKRRRRSRPRCLLSGSLDRSRPRADDGADDRARVGAAGAGRRRARQGDALPRRRPSFWAGLATSTLAEFCSAPACSTSSPKRTPCGSHRRIASRSNSAPNNLAPRTAATHRPRRRLTPRRVGTSSLEQNLSQPGTRSCSTRELVPLARRRPAAPSA